MNKISTENFEAWLNLMRSNATRKSQKSYCQKFLNLAEQNPNVESVNQLIQIGMKEEPQYQSFWQVEKSANSLLKFISMNQATVQEIQSIEEPTVQEIQSISKLEEKSRILEQHTALAKQELDNLREKERVAFEELQRAKKEELVKIAREKAEHEAKIKEGIIPRGKVLEVIQQTADLLTKPSSALISPASLEHEALIPLRSNYVWLDDERATIVGALKENENLLVYGGAGIGKSSQFEQFCFEEKIPLVRIGSNSEAIPEDLYYAKSFQDNTVIYQAKAFLQSVEIANKIGACVLVFEEINSNPESVMVAMHSMTDSIKSVMTDLGKCQLSDGCKLLVVGTANMGYAGTGVITQALESRLLPIEKKVPNREFILANIWTENVDIEVKEKLYKITEEIEKAQISKNHVFKIREPKQILKLWDSIPKNILLDSISIRWSDNIDDQETVKQIVKNAFA